VAALEVGRHICFGVLDLVGQPESARSWSIYVEPISEDSSRLILRGCIESLRKPTFFKRLANILEEPIDFVMEQRMLRTIKRLVESQ
ncbi:MAG: hypothetical protein HOH43_17415, partial [Candidatus Latescibacteria bacterium]|nr:hypothetical protein [Candidatus Latescibacterota bacterium]